MPFSTKTTISSISTSENASYAVYTALFLAFIAVSTYRELPCKSISSGKRTLRSPEMLAPARMPVAAGKKMEKTLKKVSFSEKSGGKFSLNNSPEQTLNLNTFHLFGTKSLVLMTHITQFTDSKVELIFPRS